MTSTKRLIEKTGLTPQQIRTAIKRLKKRQIINQVSTKELTKKETLLSLINPDLYLHKNSHSTKSITKDQQNSNKPSNKPQPSPNKGSTIYKKGKKEENDKNDKKINTNVQFEEFWDLYNYKKAKPKALQAYTKALTITTHEEIIKGVEAYKKARGLDKQYWKHPTTWLNAQSWGDEYVSKKRSIHDLSGLDYSQGLEGFDCH